VTAGFGLTSGTLQQLGLRHDWLGYRNIMKGIVQTAPCLKDGTLVVLVDVPARISYSLCRTDPPFDPFRDVIWFNSGLRVVYPNTTLVGIYYRTDGSASESIRYKFAAAGAALDHAGVGVGGDHFDYAHMVAFRYDSTRGAVLLDTFPEALLAGAVVPAGYRPRERISCAVPPALVQHRLDW